MDRAEAIRISMNASHQWYQGTIADVTPEQANHLPPGVVHPIGELMLHILNSEDWGINELLGGGQMIWQRDGWEAKLGVPAMIRQERDAARAVKLDPAALKPYADAVYAATEQNLAALSPEDLDQERDMGPMGKQPVALLLSLIVIGNTFTHTGEISALKGIQGAKGYQF